MAYLIVKALLSGLLVVVISEAAKRHPGLGGFLASLPLVSVLGMIWLWRDTHDAERLATHAQSTLVFVLPSLPMFAVIPALLRKGVAFWPTLAAGCVLTFALYGAVLWLAPRLGFKL